jgi:hypothetical protein
MSGFFRVVSIVAVLLSVGATPKPPADRNLVVFHNKSDVAIEYTVHKGDGADRGCVIPGGNLTRVYFVKVTAVAFTFFYEHKTCVGFGSQHTETHAFHQPQTVFQANGLNNKGYHVAVYD